MSTVTKCNHLHIELVECDEDGTGMDYYACLECNAEFEATCPFTDWDCGWNPWELPPWDKLKEVK